MVRYIIITIPPQHIRREINELRAEISNDTGSKTALMYPPHITMRTGAMVPDEKTDEFITGFDRHLEDARMVEVATGGIKTTTYTKPAGKTGYLLYYDIHLTRQLEQLHTYLLEYDTFIKRKQPEFHPHLTLAFDDLTQSACANALNAIQSGAYQPVKHYKWEIDTIALYVKEKDRWVPAFEKKPGKSVVL